MKLITDCDEIETKESKNEYIEHMCLKRHVLRNAKCYGQLKHTLNYSQSVNCFGEIMACPEYIFSSRLDYLS